MQFTPKDLAFAKNTIAFIAKTKIELQGTEIMAASDMLRWLYSLAQSIEKELHQLDKPVTEPILVPKDIAASSPIVDGESAKPARQPRKKKES